MGKMLIIKGASYTPPSSGNEGDNGQVTPGPSGETTVTPYKFYYLSGNTWYQNRSAASEITAVGMVFDDFPDSGITRIDTNLQALASTLNVLFVAGSQVGSLSGASFANPDSSAWGSAETMTASMDTSSYWTPILLWLGKDLGHVLSADEVDAIVSTARSAISFVYG